MKLRGAVRENRHVGPNKVTCEDVADFLESGEIWIWEEGGRILGFSAGDAEIGWIWALFVDPGHEGRGIGRALLTLACRTLVRAGFATATLTTDPGTRAAGFYRRGGWTELGPHGGWRDHFQAPARCTFRGLLEQEGGSSRPRG